MAQDDKEALFGIAMSKQNMADAVAETERRQAYVEALDWYQKYVSLVPNTAAPQNNMGNIWSDIAKLKGNQGAKEEAWAKAEEHYKKALNFDPKNVLAKNNYANLIWSIAREGSSQQEKFDLAIQMYEEVIKEDPSYWDAHKNLLRALFEAAGKFIEKKAVYLGRASELLKKLEVRESVDPEVSFLRGVYLEFLAESGDQGAAYDLLGKAYDEYLKAIRRDIPIIFSYTNIFGVTYKALDFLIATGRSSTFQELIEFTEKFLLKFPEVKALESSYSLFLVLLCGRRMYANFPRVEGLLLKLEGGDPGRYAYNLACVRALQGDVAGARLWLTKSKEMGRLPRAEHIKSDSDLGSLREQDWFKDLIK
jgi:tetratricopeptide (TPR) repeat protein